MADKLTNTLEGRVDRRDFLKLMGCAACTLALSGLVEAQTTTSIDPVQVVAPGELTESGQYKVFKMGRLPAIVYASDTEEQNSLAWGKVWLVAYSRRCTHQGATLREPNAAGVMHCPEHRQDFDPKTGVPVGPIHRTQIPLEQFGLEQRSDGTVWLTDVVRPV